MTSPIVFPDLFDEDDAAGKDTEDIYEEDKTREVSVTGLYSLEELFIIMAEPSSTETVRDIDDNIVDKENTTDSNSNETNLNSVFNRKVKLKPSRPLKLKNVPPASRDSPPATLDGPIEKEPELVSTHNLLKKHFQENADLTLNMGSNCEVSTNKAADIMKKSEQSAESAKTITKQKIEDKSIRRLVVGEEFLDSQRKVIDKLKNQNKIMSAKVEKLRTDLQEKENTTLKLEENQELLILKLKKARQCQKVSEDNLSSTIAEKEKISISHQNLVKEPVTNQRCEDLDLQLKNLEMDKLSLQKANSLLRTKCSELEKENAILAEKEEAQRKTSEEILMTVEAQKIKIDDILISEDEDRNQIKNLQDKIVVLSQINKGLEEQVDSLKANLLTQSGKTEMFETALREKETICVELEQKILDLKEKLQNNLDDKVAEISLLNEQGAQSKLELKEVKGRLDLEIDKTIELIKKLNYSEKLMSNRMKDVEVLTDQNIHLENKVKAFQSVVDEHKKNVKLLSEANLKVKYLEEEKRNLLKEIRNVSDLQKRINFLEAEIKKFNNRKLNYVEVLEHGTPGSLKYTAIDIPDFKDIDAIPKRISYYGMKHLESVAAEFCDSTTNSSLVHVANVKPTDTGRLNIIDTAEETPSVDVSRVTEVQAVDDVVISSEKFKSSHKRNKSSIETDLDSEDDKRERRRHKSKKIKKKMVSKSKKEENDRGRESKRQRKRCMLSSASRSRSREKIRSRSRINGKSSSRSISKSRKHEKNGKTRRTSSRSRASPSFRERKREVSGFSEKTVKSRSSTENFGTSLKLLKSQGLLPRSKSPVEVKEANFALSKEICSIMEKLKGTKAVPLSNRKKDTNSACNAVEETIGTLLSQPATNIVDNYSSELEISDEEMTLNEKCEKDEEHTENGCELVSDRYAIDEKKLVESDDVTNDKDIDESKVPRAERCPVTVGWSANCSFCGASTADVQHQEGGECRKKIYWLNQGLPVICAYCTQEGSHWVAACPLLACFCFSCFTWGHSMVTHKEQDSEKAIIRLLDKYNRFRTHHHANTGRSVRDQVFPMNSKVDGVWRFLGTLDDVENVSRKLAGLLGKPVGWLLEENWVKFRGLEKERRFDAYEKLF